MGCVKWTLIFTIVILPLSAVVVQWMNYVDIENYYKDKRIIITGASEGIGKDLAIRLSQLGARLVIAARTESKLKDTQKLCQKYSQDVFVGKLYEDTFRINTLQGVYLTQYSLPYLRKSHGTIVAISSIVGIMNAPSMAAYVASKHALQRHFGSLSLEFEKRNENISVTIMPLSIVYTENLLKQSRDLKPGGFFEPGITPVDCADRITRGIPLKRVYHYITWDAFIITRLYFLCPVCVDHLIAMAM
ncbi:11-beta-hydroxysteroid dehydrogenase 1-like isoform X3 [Dysidea avara]|uniref:11-beta-hydroxysteroid dehydrogenase 1-like isoform X3 n=1 Tax=Dysidea avara TaxID=196820 RepID=UPI003316DDCE